MLKALAFFKLDTDRGFGSDRRSRIGLMIGQSGLLRDAEIAQLWPRSVPPFLDPALPKGASTRGLESKPEDVANRWLRCIQAIESTGIRYLIDFFQLVRERVTLPPPCAEGADVGGV